MTLPLSSTHLSVLVLIIVALYSLASPKFDHLLSRMSSMPPLESLPSSPFLSHLFYDITTPLASLHIEFKVIFLNSVVPLNTFTITSDFLSRLPFSAASALPNAMIFSFLVLGQPWPTLCPLLLLVRHSGITSLAPPFRSFILSAHLSSFLSLSLSFSLYLSLPLSLTSFLELNCTEALLFGLCPRAAVCMK